MSEISLFSFGKGSNKANISEDSKIREASNNLMKQEFGVTLEKKRAASLANALKDPQKTMDNRSVAMDNAIEVADAVFNRYYEKMLKAGIPLERARNMAYMYAKATYNIEMKIYDVENPGYKLINEKINPYADNKNSTMNNERRKY